MPGTNRALRGKARGETPRSPHRSAHRTAQKTAWNAEIGRCRALRLGAHVWVTGSAPERADGRVYCAGDAEGQAARCLDLIEQALRQVDADMRDVVRTSVFLTDVLAWKAVERALAARFPNRPPAADVVEVIALPSPHMMVEIEAEAFVARA